MEMIDFFNLVLPPECVYYLVTFRGDKKAPEHRPFRSLEGLATAAVAHDEFADTSVYFACAGYHSLWVEKEAGDKRKYRVPENQFAAKAFWLDLDCGEGKSYPTKKEAASALATFCTTLNLPKPLLVDSGNGLHAYWPLAKPLAPEKWNRLAQALKTATGSFGLLADPTRTADFASILRPPGTRNKKGEAKLVKVVSQGEVTDAATLWGALKPYAEITPPKVHAP